MISVSSLISQLPLEVKFVNDACFIQDKSCSKMIGRANVWQGLYLLNTANLISDQHLISCNSVSTHSFHVSCKKDVVCNSIHKWHDRLGHPSLKHMNALKDVLPVHSLKGHCSMPCSVCPLAKQRRLSFQSNNHIAAKLFDVLHCDVWGPFQSPTYSGYRYFLTLVDDFSRHTWVFMMKTKSDALTLVPQFFRLVETQYGIMVKTFRSDNAPELSFKDFFSSKGVIYQFSCVARPEQNAVVERKHQHLLNVARALMFQSRLPIQFWGDCVLTAAFLINRTPSPLLNWQTPYFRLHNKNADYSILRSFGSLCFASSLPTHRSEFHPRAIPSVFIGYPPGMKAYRLYDIENKKVFTSRDVVFHEEIFPFHHITSHDDVVDSFPDLVLP